MKPDELPPSPIDKVDEKVAQWETRRARGESVSLSRLCHSCPELQHEVGRRIRVLESINGLLDDAVGEPLVPGQTEPPRKLGRYELIEPVGQGGFGQVWRGRDLALNRDVAIKIPRPERLGSPSQATRFLEEARKAAKLSHSGIVPVFDVGREGPYYYIVSEWIPGNNLAKRIAEDRPPFEESARIVAEVAEALQHAHLRDLVHRDIKPGNILLDAQGKAYVTDFGIAATEDELIDEHGSISGTLEYMAPEQAAGESLRITPRTDIYSLGVVLYELLTGRRPFRAKNPADLREQVRKGEPRSPRTIDGKIPEELERICLKAMAKEPGQRYSTANDMAKELRPYARPPRGRTWAVGIVVAAALLLAVMGVPVLLSWFGPTLEKPPLSGGATVRVLKADQPEQGWIDLASPQVLPLRTGDAVRIEVRLSRPAYAYLLWLNAAGDVLPIYPWEPGRWDSRPRPESPIERLGVPEDAGTGWPLKGPSGLETVLLLARDEPLPANVDLEALLADVLRPPVDRGEFAIWFRDQQPYRMLDAVDRGPDFRTVVEYRDAVTEMHRHIYRRLESHFTLHEGVSFVKIETDVGQEGGGR